MIVGTAGHIDHGKTTLVRALTGVDTDRLPEEKTRGISIELGYAYAPMANGEILGFVDVPGHERFVHTMLAGATGIDLAMLVVAADDGVMPQTREHLNILTLLGIENAAIAMTKIDAVSESRMSEVEAEVGRVLANTPFAAAPVFPVSARTGKGIGALREFLEGRASQHRPAQDDSHFRLAVDRSFTLRGIGTIVTGTVHSGEVHVGMDVALVPSGRVSRVRSLHAQDRERERGAVGERCALNLAGVARDEVKRGDWIVSPAAALSSDRFDARMTLLADQRSGLKSGATVHVHLGAAHVSARVVLLDAPSASGPERNEVAPGETALAQLVMQSSIGAWHGDRFIIRDASAARTIGGGTVLDPFAPARYRRSRERLQALDALEQATAAARLMGLVQQASLGVDLKRFARAGNICDLEALIDPLRARRVTTDGNDFAVGHDHWQALERRIDDVLAAFHESHADELGPDLARLKRMSLPRLDDGLFRALVADLVAIGKVERTGPWLHLRGHSVTPSARERALLESVVITLLETPFDPPWVRDLAKASGEAESSLRPALIRAAKRGEVFQVVRDLFYHPLAVRDLAALAGELQQADGEVRAAAFRDRTGVGRKRAIQILEFFDRVGFTRRVRDRHLVRSGNPFAPDLGSDARAKANVRIASDEEHQAT